MPGAVGSSLPSWLRLVPGDMVLLTDLWVILAILWILRVVTGGLEPSIVVLGAVAFLLVAAPRALAAHLTFSALDDASGILRRTCLAYATASAVLTLTGHGSPAALLLAAVALAGGLALGRGCSYAIERKLRLQTQGSRALIVGAGAVAKRVIAILQHREHYGLQVVGVVDDDPKLSPTELGKPVLGDATSLSETVERFRIDTVIVAFGAGDQAGLVPVIRQAMASGASVWAIPRFFELGFDVPGSDHLWGLPVMKVMPPATRRPQWWFKRTIDVVVSGAALVLLSPILAAIALATYLDSGRPILFKQTRVGMDGRPFDLLKFRTMKVADRAHEDTEWTAGEDRITRLGRFLRDTSLDEIPQLINVVRGDMSLVGPRPERPYFVELFSDLYGHYATRHRVPAGVTGWAQVNGLRGDTSIEERAMFDNHYIENWSLSSDLKIALRTVGSMVGNATLVTWKNATGRGKEKSARTRQGSGAL